MIQETAFSDIYGQEVSPAEGHQIRPDRSDRAAHSPREISIIVAAAADGGIGTGADMLWHISADLRRFKQLTMDATILMGRRTWESLPKRPLPGRLNILLTRDDAYEALGAEVCTDLADALRIAPADRPLFVIGGGEIYRQLRPLTDTILLTRIFAADPQASVFFLMPEEPDWHMTEVSETFPATDTHPAYRFETWKRQ